MTNSIKTTIEQHTESDRTFAFEVEVYPGSPATHWHPGDPAEVEILSVECGGKKLAGWREAAAIARFGADVTEDALEEAAGCGDDYDDRDYDDREYDDGDDYGCDD